MCASHEPCQMGSVGLDLTFWHIFKGRDTLGGGSTKWMSLRRQQHALLGISGSIVDTTTP